MKNAALFEQAKKIIPGGVNSPVRAFGKVGGTPRFISRAEGAWLWDVEGKRYIDHVLSWGPMILGHLHPEVMDAVIGQAKTGMSYGAPTKLENEMAEIVCDAFESMDQVRFVSSGTEATMSAIRLARGYKGRDIIVKFEGCYHGHVDSLLAKAGSGALTLGIPDTPGVPASVVSQSAVLPYNDTEGFIEFMRSHGAEVAAVIVEPVAGNMGVIQAKEGFLETLRKETLECGALLIFDEVITGFRFCFGGMQRLVDIQPDITCLGKIIGGGLPVGAFGGRREIMSLLAPDGPVYQAGTLSGNPMAMAAGLATLRVLKREDPYGRLEKNMNMFMDGIVSIAQKRQVALSVNHTGSMGSIFFGPGQVDNYEAVTVSDAAMYALFFHAMLERGVYLAPSPYEALFIGVAHGDDILGASLDAVDVSLSEIA